ncbi:MAG: molybdopterin-dependent oxidoreductase, partial [candidate division Zixibacteria bacterium]|nr:molybdopterin-dependent oxidoreductase [candidate division Zixibacteria bacterium]NIR64238.1 molybdopterin-dependent oxidoreductase [candidate division Zixibacteria bacterium]NIS15812.1 molybdopterin-dependent oxidoreductase [candidate division Zixibacteria bacterium]NIS46138.1 molybdopterin-dependent oxidoreductase [candidate division Zixibacteria bacterium]NIT53080.1 molybdopterin-dependent oxidoreductase [candidate division Zixibacteria bacterium]
FLTDTARLADVVLPISSNFETDGTFVNWEGVIQKYTKAIKNIGESMPLWEIFTKLAGVFGVDFNFRTADDVFRQYAPIIGKHGIDRMATIPETGIRFQKRKDYPDIGLMPVSYRQPSSEDLPLTVLSGNGDHHFSRNFSTRCESLNNFLADPYIAINEKLAEDMIISEGDLIKLENSSGKIVAKALIWPNLPEDVVFVPDNFI